MARKWFVIPVLALAAGIAFPGHHFSISALQAPQGYGRGDWSAPPRELNEMQRRGYRDGIEGARKDFGNGRRADVNNREEYRNPDQMPRDIPPGLREAWRDGFRRGYASAAAHLWNGAPPQPQYRPQPAYAPPPQPRNWDQWGMRGMQSDAQQRGYHDGAESAEKDFDTGRPPDPDRHPAYLNPRVAPPFVDEYREGFMRGYTITTSRMSGEPDWQQYNGDPGQWRAPDSYSDAKRQGFRDGIDGARKDFGNHRRPDPNNRDEYRSPNYPEPLRGEYREGFRRGYEITVTRLWGGM